jgi:4-amino-4-deoxy-L-arabinose transferase-like glycosyltransferase
VELDAALITASCAAIVGFGHAASTDAPLACTFAIALLAWMTWYKEGHRVWLAAFYVLLALATLAKGPVAPFLAAFVILVFVAVRREWPVIKHSLWIPGILLYLAVALPWYVLVQLHTGTFFRVFILEHNLQRYTTTVYRHTQPFWYFGPVLLLTLFPWTVLAITALVGAARRAFGSTREEAQGEDGKTDIELFLLVWGVLPVIFFSLSGSKLPGYILPAVPPFALLTAGWLRRKLAHGESLNRLLVLLHGLIAGFLLGAALVAPYLALRLRVPRETLTIAVVAGAAMFAVVAITIHRSGLKALRFVTVLPVVLGLAFLLRMAGPALDDALSARPVAKQLVQFAPSGTPVAVLNARREVEYGLTFYLNQPVMRYERGEAPAAAHLLIARKKDYAEVEQAVKGRALVHLGGSARQGLDYYRVSAR